MLHLMGSQSQTQASNRTTISTELQEDWRRRRFGIWTVRSLVFNVII